LFQASVIESSQFLQSRTFQSDDPRRIVDGMSDASSAGWIMTSVASLDPVFTAQLITYLRMTRLRVGLLVNFSQPKLVDRLERIVL
jgi:hypothetical protein